MASDCKASWNIHPRVISAFSNKGRALNLAKALLPSVKLIPQWVFFLHTTEPTK